MTLSLRTQQIIALESGVTAHRRPARRLVLRGAAHRRARGARGRRARPRSTRWGRGRRDRARASRSDGSPSPPTGSSATSPRAHGRASGVNVHADPDEAPVELPEAFALDAGVVERQVARTAARVARARRRRVLGRDRGRRRGGARGPQRHARARGRRARGRDARRAVGRVPRRVRRVPGAASVVSAPLDGLRVLDLTRFVAGSQATALLAALGADVVKLEVPPGGDPYRVQGTERLGDQSVLFLSLNSGKRSVAIDFRSPSAADAVDRLLAIVRLRRGERAARAASRRTASTGSRSTRGTRRSSTDRSPATATWVPQASRGGFDLILQAESGVMSVTGERGVGTGQGRRAGAGRRRRDQLRVRAPGRPPRTAADRRGTTGLFVADGVRAHEPRDAGGELRSSPGEVPGLLGTHSPTFAPYGGFRTADGWIVLAGAGSEDLWVRCCTVLGADALVDDPRFADNASRVRNRDELTERVRGGARTGTERALARAARGRGRAGRGGPRHRAGLRRARRPRRSAPSRRSRHPEAGDYRVVGAPMRFDRAPFPYPSAAPALGAHTREVLTEVGLSADAVRRARVRPGWRSRRDRGDVGGRSRAPAHDRARGDPGADGLRGRPAPAWCGRGGARTGGPTCAWTRPGTCGRSRARRRGRRRGPAARTSTPCSAPGMSARDAHGRLPAARAGRRRRRRGGGRARRPRHAAARRAGRPVWLLAIGRRGGPREPARRHPRRSTRLRCPSARSSPWRATTSAGSRPSASARSGAASR